MAIRLNDIESTLRIGIEGATTNLDRAASKAENFGTRLSKADRDLGKFGRGINQAAAASDAAFSLIEASSGRSLGSVQAATAGVLSAAGSTAIVASTLGNTVGAVTKLTASVSGLSSALSIGLVGGLVLVAAFAVKTVVELNKITKETEAINDNIEKFPTLAKQKAELAALSGTVKQLEAGTISAADAQEEFNRFGIDSVEAAQRRVEVLKTTTARLGELAQAEAAVNREREHALDIDKKVAERAKSRQEAIEVEIAEEKALAEAQARFAAQGAFEVQPGAFGAPQPVFPGAEELPAVLDELGRAGDEFKNRKSDLDLLIEAGEKLGGTMEVVAEKTTSAAEAGDQFGKQVESSINIAGVRASQLAVAVGENFLVNAGKGAAGLKSLFKNLLADLARAIAQAVILNKLVGSLGGGGILGFVGGLFQDPKADLFARFEGTRFADLFFQGVNRQIGGAQTRIDTALNENRDVQDQQGRPVNVQVHEAMPETWVEVTDRHIEPRVRRRGFQRTGKALPQGRI